MSGERLFGTDGIRSVANTGPLTPENVLALGRALARLASERASAGPVAIARDPRRSSPLLQAALTSGIVAEGVDVLDLGVLPTPALATLLPRLDAALGVMVSASHNPMPDNGIKVLAADGSKIPDEDERRLEADLGVRPGDCAPTGAAIGTVKSLPDAVERYVEALLERFPGLRLDGSVVFVDAAHGAASRAAPLLFERLGAEVVRFRTDPNGLNINDQCGAVHPEALAAAVAQRKDAVGVALDGDGDRMIFVSEAGRIRDGDHVLYACARDRIARGKLAKRVVVGTVMTNFGLERALTEWGGRLERTPVGDRHVAEALKRHGWSLGGEPSGHLIFGADHGFVGDGLYSALALLEAARRSGGPSEELFSGFEPVPQRLINVPVAERRPIEQVEELSRAILDAQRRLEGRGRVLVRYSGTEPLLRIMVEGTDSEETERVARGLAERAAELLGAADRAP